MIDERTRRSTRGAHDFSPAVCGECGGKVLTARVDERLRCRACRRKTELEAKARRRAARDAA